MDDPTTFLDKLTGRWELVGDMSGTPLHQEVSAAWVLGTQYVEMRCRSVLPPEPGTPPYEAVYLIGYHQPSDQYVLHLFDTFGVALHPVPGIGRREGNAISFLFDYEPGPFLNRFTWDEEAGRWEHFLENQAGDRSEVFATKRLHRMPG